MKINDIEFKILEPDINKYCYTCVERNKTLIEIKLLVSTFICNECLHYLNFKMCEHMEDKEDV